MAEITTDMNILWSPLLDRIEKWKLKTLAWMFNLTEGFCMRCSNLSNQLDYLKFLSSWSVLLSYLWYIFNLAISIKTFHLTTVQLLTSSLLPMHPVLDIPVL